MVFPIASETEGSPSLIRSDVRQTTDFLQWSPPRVWIEDFKDVAHRAQQAHRLQIELACGVLLPMRNGADRYSLMREPKVDDLVIHVKEGIIIGWSYVSSPFRELGEEPPSPGPWAGRPSCCAKSISKDISSSPTRSH